jgi:hypothetical protein
MRQSTYIFVVGQPTMAINVVRNKRYGPGGSTRRLHHKHTIPGVNRDAGYRIPSVFLMGANQDRRAW